MKNLHSGLILLCLLFFFSCQKEETFIQEDPVITTEITLKNIIADDPLMDKFFNGINDHDIPVSADKKETIDRIKLAMIKDHKTTPFVDGYIREVGFPLWGQAKLHQQGSGNFVYALPFAKKASTFTTAILHVASINEKFVYELALRTDVKEYLVAYNTDSQTFYWENLLGFLAGFNAYDENIFGFSDSFILEWLSQNQDTYLVDAADTRGCSGAVLRYCQDNYALDERGDERSSPCGPSQIELAIVIIVCESPTGGGGSPNVPIIGDDDNLGGGGSPNDGGSSPGGSPTFEDRLCNIDASISFFQTYNIQPTTVLRDALNNNIVGCTRMSQEEFNEQALEIVITIRAEQAINNLNLPISVEELLEIIDGNCLTNTQDAFEVCAENQILQNFPDISEFVNFDLSTLEGKRIKLLDCASYEWTQVGQGWVACLDPNNLDIDVANTGVFFAIDMGCLSFTIPKTRRDINGNFIQMIGSDEASSCAALAANLATLAVKLAIDLTPPQNLDNALTEWFMRKIFKEAYSEWIEETSCGTFGPWSGPIATCNSNNCPNGSSVPIYSDDFIEVTQESLLGECY